MTVIQIIKAKKEDCQKIAHLFDNYRQFYGQESDITTAQAFIYQRLECQQSVIFYAERKIKDKVGKQLNQCVGFTQLYPTFSSVSASKQWILNDLYVEALYRGQGVGHKLLDIAKQFAIADKANALILSTEIDNVGAQALYESLGYEKNTRYFNYALRL